MKIKLYPKELLEAAWKQEERVYAGRPRGYHEAVLRF